MIKSQMKPWLNEDGRVKSEAELKEVCQQWRPSVWEAYLATVEVRRRKEEAILPPAALDSFSTARHLSCAFSGAEEESHPFLKVALNACLCELTPRQRSVVIDRYWQGKTITAIAASTGVSKQAVSQTIKTALARIRTSLTDGSFQRRLMVAKEMLAS